jgi:hypothetical protein
MKDIEIFRNILTKEQCSDWISKAPKFTGSYDFNDRTVDITNSFIVNTVKDVIEKKCNCKLTCSQAQIQLWPVGSNSNLHIHTYNNRENTDYNSLLYLNNDFGGGEFITKNLIIKPEPGMLTFFDGSKIYHGVNEVESKHRYTLIFWWENTLFYGE